MQLSSEKLLSGAKTNAPRTKLALGLLAPPFTFQERTGEEVAAELTRTASTTWGGCYESNAMLRAEFNALCSPAAR